MAAGAPGTCVDCGKHLGAFARVIGETRCYDCATRYTRLPPAAERSSSDVRTVLPSASTDSPNAEVQHFTPLVTAVGLAVIGLFVIFIGVQYIAYDAAYSREGVRVAATVTSLVELSSYDSGSEYIVHYRFTTAEGRLMAGSSSVAHPAYFESHRAIRIQYVRSRPEHSRIGRSAVSESFTGERWLPLGFSSPDTHS